MLRLKALAKRVVGKKFEPLYGCWSQEEDKILVPEGDEEGLLHEILHWIVASDEERTWPNLALDEDEVPWINKELPREERLKKWTVKTPARRERQVCYLTRKVYALRGWSAPTSSSCTSYKASSRADKEVGRYAPRPVLDDARGACRSP